MSIASPSEAAARSRDDAAVQPVLLNGAWKSDDAGEQFQATNPRTREVLPDLFPVSDWRHIDTALAAATVAAAELRALPDVGERVALFLEGYARGIEARATELVAIAARETGLPATPRLQDVELPRTTGQLRQAAAAAREGSWLFPIIDTKTGLRSCLAPIGPVLVIGPNNFPFAFNGIAGGDFAAAVAAGNPVIAKGHPLHPGTTRLLAEAALESAQAARLPTGTVQMLYHMQPSDGLRAVADPRLKAVAFTGSRAGGLKLKAAADAAGKLFFGEMSSINPVVILPGALSECAEGIVDAFATSILMGAGQFCTKPGLVLMLQGPQTDAFTAKVQAKLAAAPAGVLFSAAGQSSLVSSIQSVHAAGADLLTGGEAAQGNSFGVQNALLRVSGAKFLESPHAFQTEAFGTASLIVIAESVKQLRDILNTLEGNLTGTIYSAPSGADDAAYADLAPVLRTRVGRLINDKMPTGVAVSPAMNHGGPYPATSQPHFTAVGLPNSILRFTQLESYDNVREHRLPPCLRNRNPGGRMWRQIDGHWSQADVGAT